MKVEKVRDPQPPVKTVVVTMTPEEWADWQNIAHIYLNLSVRGEVSGVSLETAKGILEAK